MKAVEKKKRSKLRTQIDAIIYFFKKMDDEMIGDILNRDRTYQDMSHTEFIDKLSDLFDVFHDLGDSRLITANKVEGVYNGTEVIALSFIGNKSKNYIDILFELDAFRNVTDMYEFEDPDSDRGLWFQEGRLFLDTDDFYEEDDGYEDAGYDEDDIDFPFN